MLTLFGYFYSLRLIFTLFLTDFYSLCRVKTGRRRWLRSWRPSWPCQTSSPWRRRLFSGLSSRGILVRTYQPIISDHKEIVRIRFRFRSGSKCIAGSDLYTKMWFFVQIYQFVQFVVDFRYIPCTVKMPGSYSNPHARRAKNWATRNRYQASKLCLTLCDCELFVRCWYNLLII